MTFMGIPIMNIVIFSIIGAAVVLLARFIWWLLSVDSSPKVTILITLARYLTGSAALLCYVGLTAYGVMQLPPLSAVITASLLISLVIFLVILPLFPGAIEYLSNNPNRLRKYYSEENQAAGNYPVSEFGFFTFVIPGQVKIIERGKRFIRCVMRYDDHTFFGVSKGGLEEGVRRNELEYWDVIKSKKYNDEDFHPIPDLGFWSWVNPIWWWARFIYRLTGGVFTGIYPFQRVRTYQITRLEKVLKEDGTFEFRPKTDFSDHYRVAPTQLFVEVPEADTSDKIPVIVKKVQTVQVTNPYSTAYNTDADWTTRFFTAAADAINAFTRSRSVDDVMSVTEGKGEAVFGEHVVKRLNKKPTKTGKVSHPVVSTFGLLVSESALLDITPTRPTSEAQERLADLAFARVDRAAREERGRGEAKAVEDMVLAATSRGQQGVDVFNQEANVRVAEAAGKSGGTVIVDTGGSTGGKNITPGLAFLKETIEEGRK